MSTLLIRPDRVFDGTRVRGDGFVTFTDGNTLQMTEGQMMTVPGVNASW